MSLQAVLKMRRKELSLTLKEIADRMGVTEATVQRWESGNIKNLRHERITKLAEILDTTPACLMGWDELPDIMLDKKMQDDPNLVVGRIYECIQNSNLSYAELANITGIAKSALHRYATGQTQKIPVAAVEKIAEATGVTSQWILGYELPDKAEQSEEEAENEELFNIFSSLPEDRQKIVADLIRTLSKGL